VEVTAESLYEAAALGLSLLRHDGWVSQLAPGTQLQVEVRSPATTHCVTVAQLRRWAEAITPSPDDTIKRRKVSKLLA
jgi:hypothetical protein